MNQPIQKITLPPSQHNAADNNHERRNAKMNSQLMETMVASVCEKLQMWFEVFGDKDKAIAKAKDESCAGAGAWKIAIERMGW